MSINYELTADAVNQMAFEEGSPADDGDGYTFTQEEFDIFTQRVIDAALNSDL